MRIITTQIDKPELLGAYEEAFCLLRAENKTPDTIWLWKHPKLIYLVNNSSVNFINQEYAKEMGYSLVRSAIFPGKPTTSIICGTDWGLLTATKYDFGNVISNLHEKLWGYFTPIRGGISNDQLVPNTEKKLGGVVTAKIKDVFCSQSTFLETKPDIDLDKLFKGSLGQRGGTKTTSHSERMTSYFDQSGKLFEQDKLLKRLTDVLEKLGLVIEMEELTTHELNLVNELSKKHLSEKWIMHGNILMITKPIEAFQVYVEETDLSEEEEALLLSKFKGKLPTAEKELQTGVITRKKYGNN